MKGRTLLVVLMVVVATLPTAAGARGSEMSWSDTPTGETRHAMERQTSPSASDEETPTPDEALASSPVMFVENAGQWNDNARFQVWGGPAATIWLAEDAIWLTVLEPEDEAPEVDIAGVLPRHRVDIPSPRRGVNVKLSFVGANRQPRMETIDPLDTTISYFYGNGPGQWRPDVPVWGGVRYVDLYPGVDLELTGEDGQLALRLAARTDGDLSAVMLRVEGVDAVTVDEDYLRLTTAAGDIAFPLLQAAKYSTRRPYSRTGRNNSRFPLRLLPRHRRLTSPGPFRTLHPMLALL